MCNLPPVLGHRVLRLDVNPDYESPQPSQGPESHHRVKCEVDSVDAEDASCLLGNTHFDSEDRAVLAYHKLLKASAHSY